MTGQTSITSATFTGLITGASPLSNIGEVRVEIYRVFPLDSNTARTTFPVPPFSTSQVPARQNSPSDVEFHDRDTSPAPGNLTFTTKDLGSFTALNSVQPGGIHPLPGVTTGGNGPITGEEVEFDVNFTSPFLLPPDHYFFVPQVEITNPSGDFFWLSGTVLSFRRRFRRESQTCNHGRVIKCLTRIGFASGKTLSVAPHSRRLTLHSR